MNRRSQQDRKMVRELVSHYEEYKPSFERFLNSLQNQISTAPNLIPYIHSLKVRTKTSISLEDKIFRKLDEARKAKKQFSIQKDNLFLKINDLAGLRILHLNTDQLPFIAKGLKELFDEEFYRLIEKPSARTWDDESKVLLSNMGFKIVSKPSKPSFYTSVHYVIKPNKKTAITCEIQVRTLMEEVWGEVDHRLNYPHSTKIFACKEQIAALARATSSCSRLVDSIFRSHADLSRSRMRLTRP